jgi:hypothetical protein
VASPLGMGHELANVLRDGVAYDGELDGHLLEMGWGVIDVVLLRVAEAGSNISRRVLDRDLVEWREPRQLGQQSKGCSHHQVLER